MIKVYEVSRKYMMLFMHNNRCLPLTGLLTLLHWIIQHAPIVHREIFEIFQKYFTKYFLKYFTPKISWNCTSLTTVQLGMTESNSNISTFDDSHYAVHSICAFIGCESHSESSSNWRSVISTAHEVTCRHISKLTSDCDWLKRTLDVGLVRCKVAVACPLQSAIVWCGNW